MLTHEELLVVLLSNNRTSKSTDLSLFYADERKDKITAKELIKKLKTIAEMMKHKARSWPAGLEEELRPGKTA
jgi:hypothetical protein